MAKEEQSKTQYITEQVLNNKFAKRMISQNSELRKQNQMLLRQIAALTRRR